MAHAPPNPVDPWLAALLAVVDEAIIGTATEGAVVCWSEGARKLLGYTAEEAIGQPRSSLTAGEEPDGIDGLPQEASASVLPASRDVAWRSKDGSTLRLPTFLFAVRDPLGQPCGLLEFVRSGERNDSFDRAALIALREKVALLVLELSQPITAIGAYLQGSRHLLDRGVLSELPKVSAAIEQTLAEASRAADVVRRLRLSASADTDQDRTSTT